MGFRGRMTSKSLKGPCVGSTNSIFDQTDCPISSNVHDCCYCHSGSPSYQCHMLKWLAWLSQFGQQRSEVFFFDFFNIFPFYHIVFQYTVYLLLRSLVSPFCNILSGSLTFFQQKRVYFVLAQGTFEIILQSLGTQSFVIIDPFLYRWQIRKISHTMGGNRTPRQVASRVQKYFEKLKRFGVQRSTFIRDLEQLDLSICELLINLLCTPSMISCNFNSSLDRIGQTDAKW